MQVTFNCGLLWFEICHQTTRELSLGSNIVHCVLSAEVLPGGGAGQSGECTEETGRHQ